MPENATDLVPQYGDFTNVGDYRSALEAVQRANENFMQLPAELRARWDNDPQKFLEYAHNPENLPEMRKFGLAKPETPEPPLSRETQAIVEAVKTAAGNKPST